MCRDPDGDLCHTLMVRCIWVCAANVLFGSQLGPQGLPLED